MIKGLSHVSLIVPSLEAACERMSRVYGLSVGPVMVNAQQGVRLVYVDLGNAKLEMIEPAPDNAALMRFLERHPQGGLHHIALAVDSLDQTCAQLAPAGVTPLSAAGARNVHGEPIAFIHPKDFSGALLELEEADHGEKKEAGH